MRRMRFGLLLILIICSFLTAGLASAADASTSWFERDAKHEPKLRVDVFTTSDCPHCQKLMAFLKAKVPQNPWLNVTYYVINQDKVALLTYFKELKLKNLEDFAVPAVFFCNSRWVGFSNAESSGKILMDNLNYCRQNIIKEGSVTPHTEERLKQMSYAHWNQENFDKPMPDWMVLLSMAFFDSISPESLFITLTLICFMRIEESLQLKIATFVLFLLGLGGAHYFQQINPEIYYESLPLVRLPSLLIGLGLLIYLFIFHPKRFAIRRPLPVGLSLIWFLLTGLAVQWYQQMHIPNFSLSFLQWMQAKNNLVSYGSWAYPLVYQLAYLVSIGFITWVLFMLVICYGKWTRHQMLVGEFCWQYLIMIGLILVVYPYLFAMQSYASLTFFAVLLTSWLSYRFWSKKHPDEHLK